MGAWEFLVTAVEWTALGLVLVLMGWAAIERARLRHQWLRLRHHLDGTRAPFDWCIATSVLAGCV